MLYCLSLLSLACCSINRMSAISTSEMLVSTFWELRIYYESYNFPLSSLELVVYFIIVSSSLMTWSKMLTFLIILVPSLDRRELQAFLREDNSQDLYFWLGGRADIAWDMLLPFFLRSIWNSEGAKSLRVFKFDVFIVFLSLIGVLISLCFFLILFGEGLPDI